MPSRWSFTRRHMLDIGELMWTPMSRVGTRGIRRPAGAVENMRRLWLFRPQDFVPSPSHRRAARCWPSAGLPGGQLAVSSHVLWIVCSRLPLRWYRGPGLFAPQSHCPRSSWRQGSHLPYTSTGLLRSNATSPSVKCQAGT